MIEFNGPLKSRLAGWIASKGWFPARLHPKIPCTLKNMKVNWQENTVAVSGNILQGGLVESYETRVHHEFEAPEKHQILPWSETARRFSWF